MKHHVTRREKRKAARSRFDFGETWTATAKPYRAGWLPWREEDTARFWAMVKRIKCRDRSRRNNGHARWGQDPLRSTEYSICFEP